MNVAILSYMKQEIWMVDPDDELMLKYPNILQILYIAPETIQPSKMIYNRFVLCCDELLQSVDCALIFLHCKATWKHTREIDKIAHNATMILADNAYSLDKRKDMTNEDSRSPPKFLKQFFQVTIVCPHGMFDQRRLMGINL